MKTIRRVAVLGAGTMGARIAAHFATVGTGAHGLAVQTARGGLRFFTDGPPDLGAQPVVEFGPQAGATPAAEVMIDGWPRGKVFGQEPPLRTRFDEVEAGVENGAQIRARSTAFFCGGQEPPKQVPLVGGEVGVVGSDFHRLISAAAKVNVEKAQSNQGLYRFISTATFPIQSISFFRQALKQGQAFRSQFHFAARAERRPTTST